MGTHVSRGLPRILLAALLLGILTTPAATRTAQAQADAPRLPDDAQSRYTPKGPPPKDGYQPYLGRVSTRTEVVIGGVPAYLWWHGCGPTCAGMVIGYWDGKGFGNLIPGDAAIQNDAVRQAIATGDGPNTHFGDYSLPLDAPPNPLQPDRSEPPEGDEHPSDCLADFMRTSWSAESNYYGWSWFSHVDDALTGYVRWVNTNRHTEYLASTRSETFANFTWEKLKAEIEAKRPLVFLVDSDGDGATDHFVTVIGWRDIDGLEYACLDTWEAGIRWELFRGMAPGQTFGVYGAICFKVEKGLAGRPLVPRPVVQGVPRDTVWFGGYNEAEGIAYNSAYDGYDTAVWTWDAGTEDPLEGWTSLDIGGMGTHMSTCTEAQWSAWILGPPSTVTPCYLSGNALYCATVIPSSPRPGHLSGHHEYLISPIVDREGFTAEDGYFDVIGRWDSFYYLRWSGATFYRPGVFYYPYTTPDDPNPHWSERSGQAVWHYTGQSPLCTRNETVSLSAPVDGTPLPSSWERLRLILEVITDCSAFGIPAAECGNEGRTNAAPIYDNVRVGIAGGVNAPPIALGTGHLFHDAFGQALPTFLDPGDVCHIDVAYDMSLDEPAANDWLADTAVVTGPLATLPEYWYWIDLCLKVAKKGPRQDMISGYSAWKRRLPGDPEKSYVCALMDTAMSQAEWDWAPTQEGQARATYFHEDDPGFDPTHGDCTPEQEILPDNIFTPGTRIEYYYRSRWAQNPQDYFTIPAQAPDANVSEVEFLPMMELNLDTPDEYDCVWPSVLYIDAFGGGAAAYITAALDEELGVGTYDEYDRQGFSTNYDAPMARSFGGALYNPGGYGNNGCTLEQLLGYRLILWNSGSYGIGGGEARDFGMLANWLTTTECGLTDTRRGLIMNGNEIAEVMGEPTEGKAILFCNNTLGTLFTDHAYRYYNNDDFDCVWIAPQWYYSEFVPAADISVFGNGVRLASNFNVLTPAVPGIGNLHFLPGTGAANPTYPLVNYSQILTENPAGPGGTGGYKTAVDGFSFHLLSEVWYGGEECSDDSLAIIAGCADLLGPELAWMVDNGAAPFAKWRYPCLDDAVDDGGETHVSGPVNFLYPSQPNPFRSSATIRFTAAAEGPVKIVVYDVSGRLIRTLHDGKAQPGETTLVWDGRDDAGNPASGGIFWMEMSTSGYHSSKRVVAVR